MDELNPYEHGLAFLNGDVVPMAHATIPIAEAGFTRSDVTYDVTSVWKGRFFRLDDHLDRFGRSMERMRFELPWGRDEIRGVLMSLVADSGLQDAYVSMIATRGFPPSGSRDPRRFTNRFYAFACPFLWVFSPELQERGIKAIVSSIERTPSTSFDPTVKNFQWGDLTRGTWEALDRGAEAGILLDRDGNVTEGAGYNVFAIIDGVVTTPENGALLGITRRTVLELVEENGLPSKVGALHVDDFRRAEEIFFATTAGGVMPVGELDGLPVGEGGPGPISSRIRQWYWAAREDPRFTTPVAYGGPQLDNRS